jgi:hypothetical protein
MDSWLGLGSLSLALFGRGYDWEEGYAPLHRKILGSMSMQEKPSEGLLEESKSLVE